MCVHKFQHIHYRTVWFIIQFTLKRFCSVFISCIIGGTNRMTTHYFICIHSVQKRLVEQERPYNEWENQIWPPIGTSYSLVSWTRRARRTHRSVCCYHLRLQFPLLCGHRQLSKLAQQSIPRRTYHGVLFGGFPTWGPQTTDILQNGHSVPRWVIWVRWQNTNGWTTTAAATTTTTTTVAAAAAILTD